MASRHPPPLDGLDLLVKGGVLTRWYEDLLYVISSFLSQEEGGNQRDRLLVRWVRFRIRAPCLPDGIPFSILIVSAAAPL